MQGLGIVDADGESIGPSGRKVRVPQDDNSVFRELVTACRHGNRRALEWVIDQYQVSTDKRSRITNDPNREDDKEYILRLIGQTITVRQETVRIVNALPPQVLPES